MREAKEMNIAEIIAIKTPVSISPNRSFMSLKALAIDGLTKTVNNIPAVLKETKIKPLE
jgi:hypothetical protein